MNESDPWNRNYPHGVKCEPCSARSPVPVFHPADRPCDKVQLAIVPRGTLDGCFCQPTGPPYAGCPVHGEY